MAGTAQPRDPNALREAYEKLQAARRAWDDEIRRLIAGEVPDGEKLLKEITPAYQAANAAFMKIAEAFVRKGPRMHDND